MLLKLSEREELDVSVELEFAAPARLGVRIHYETLPAAAGDVVAQLSWPRSATSPAIAELCVTDQHGAAAVYESIVGSGSERVHQWICGRDLTRGSTVRYSVKVHDGATGAASLEPLPSHWHDTVFTGSGRTFLALRPHPEPLNWRVEWAEMDGGLPNAATSRGEGSLSATARLLETAQYTYFMLNPSAKIVSNSGLVRGYAASSDSATLASAVEYADETAHWLLALFAEKARAYRLFLTRPQAASAHGTAIPGGVVVSLGDRWKPVEHGLACLIAHEAVHEWLWLHGPIDEVNWLNEGVAEYYSIRALIETGNVEAAAMRRRIERALEVEARAVTPSSGRELLYARGLLYFARAQRALMDQQRRDLDHLVRAVRAELRAGGQVTPEGWRRMLRAELGETDSVLWAQATGDVPEGAPGRLVSEELAALTEALGAK